MKDGPFRPYEPGQSLLLPQNLNDWLPEDHPAFFIRDVVAELEAEVKELMARRLRTKKGREKYARRKSSVEPVCASRTTC